MSDPQDPFVAAMARGRADLFARGFRDLYAEDCGAGVVSILAKCAADIRVEMACDYTPPEVEAAREAAREAFKLRWGAP